MNISLDCYRLAIGVWHHVSLSRDCKSTKFLLSPIKVKLLLAFFLSANGVFIGALLLLRCGDIHPKPGPPNPVPPNPVPSYENKSLSICHVNIQSLYLISDKVYPQRKMDEIESLLMNDLQFDAICLSETWLKPNIAEN